MRFEHLSNHPEREATYSNPHIKGFGLKSYTPTRFAPKENLLLHQGVQQEVVILRLPLKRGQGCD
jgi:hypothetical protein